ncbi:hypothetical protein RKD28_003042 [Streptomyces sp. SAI-229]
MTAVDGEAVRPKSEADEPGWEADPDDEWGAAVITTVGRQLKLRREAAGMRAGRFGAAIGYGEDLVYKVEGGKRIPQREYLDRADEVLGAGGLRAAARALRAGSSVVRAERFTSVTPQGRLRTVTSRPGATGAAPSTGRARSGPSSAAVSSVSSVTGHTAAPPVMTPLFSRSSGLPTPPPVRTADDPARPLVSS